MNTLEHAQEAFSLVSRYLPSDISTVHDYGCWDGKGTAWLTSCYSHVVGFDIDLEHVNNLPNGVEVREGDVRKPQGVADVIYVGHILEGSLWEKHFPDPIAIVSDLRDHCRYLILHVHRCGNERYEWQNELVPDALYHSNYSCCAGKNDSVTLLRGHFEP